MSHDDWKEWISKQLIALIGQTTEFAHGRWDVYDETLTMLRQRAFQITADWLMEQIHKERRSVLLSMDDPPHRSCHEYHQGRISAYQHMYQQMKSPGLIQDPGDFTSSGDTAIDFAPHTQPQ